MKKFYYNNLYDYYKELFTKKQQEYFESYHFDDYSLGEISENNDVSRNAVYKEVKKVEEKLDYFESKLHLYENSQNIKEIIKDLDSNIKEKIEKYI